MITVFAMNAPGPLWTALVVSSFALVAQAQPGDPDGTQASPEPTRDTSERWNAREARPPTETRSGHLVASGSVGWAIPFGTVSQDASQSARFGSGLGYQVDVGYGVGRSVFVGAWGQLLTLGDGSACADCSGTSWAFGPFVRYHLAQGLRFDPWFSFGLGYRIQSHEIAGSRRSYTGVDFARVQLGGDWYALPQLGLGPFIELGTGSFFTRPDDERAGGLHWRFITGLRVTLDVLGR